MNWKDIKNIIKEELQEATEEKYIVVGSKGDGQIQYGPSYDSKEKAQAVADKKNKQSKYTATGISFSTQKGPLQEATTVTAGSTKFNLRTGVNKNPTKLGIKIQFEPLAGELEKEVKSKLEVALQEKLNIALAQYDIQISKDTDVPRPNVIGFFIPLSQLKNLIVKALTGEKVDAPSVEAPEPNGGEEADIEEMIRNEMLNEMRVRDLNEASSIVDKDDFYSFINAGNNILRTFEENGKSKSEAKKYLSYLTKHNIM
jgi:hypothetical protein